MEKLERSLASAPAGGSLMERATAVDGVKVLATEVEAPSADALRYFGDSVKKDLDSGVAVLATAIDGRPQFLAIVSKDMVGRGVHAGNLVRANDTVPLVVINQVSPIYVSFAIPESQLPAFKRYMAAGSVRVRRTSGTAPWIAYGVVNDGAAPGERTGDGAYVAMAVE